MGRGRDRCRQPRRRRASGDSPGEEILDALFLQYAGRHFDKRTDGAAIAAAMKPRAELAQLLKAFMTP